MEIAVWNHEGMALKQKRGAPVSRAYDCTAYDLAASIMEADGTLEYDPLPEWCAAAPRTLGYVVMGRE